MMSIEKLIFRGLIRTKISLSLKKIFSKISPLSQSLRNNPKVSLEYENKTHSKKDYTKTKNYFFGYEYMAMKIGIRNQFLIPLPFLIIFLTISTMSLFFEITDFSHIITYDLPWFVLFVVIMYGGLFYKKQFFKSFDKLKKRKIIKDKIYKNARNNLSSKKLFVILLVIFISVPLVGVYSNTFTENPLLVLLSRPTEFYALAVMYPIGAQIFSSLIKGSLLPITLNKTNLNIDLFNADNYAGLRPLIDITGLPIFLFFFVVAISFYSTIESDDLSNDSEWILFLFQMGMVVTGLLLFSFSQIIIRKIIITKKNMFLNKLNINYADIYKNLMNFNKDDRNYSKLRKYESTMFFTESLQKRIDMVNVCPFNATRIRFMASFIFAIISIIATNTNLMILPNFSEFQNIIMSLFDLI